MGGAYVTVMCPSCGSDYYNLYCVLEGLVKESIQKGLGCQRIWQTPTEDGGHRAQCWDPTDAQWR